MYVLVTIHNRHRGKGVDWVLERLVKNCGKVWKIERTEIKRHTYTWVWTLGKVSQHQDYAQWHLMFMVALSELNQTVEITSQENFGVSAAHTSVSRQ